MRSWAAVVVAGALLAAGRMELHPSSVHVVAFSPGRDALRVHRSATPSGGLFEDMARAAHAETAINGTYYGTDGLPLGLLRSNGRWLFRGGRMKTVFTVDAAGRAAIVSREAVRKNPAGYPFAVAAGPRLLRGGAIGLNPEAEGFHAAARRIRASRVALAIRRNGTGLMIVDEDDVTLAEFAAVCRSAGAVDALNLDGGGATALYRHGQTLVSPRLPMADIITVKRR